MPPVITLQGIDEALKNLNFKNQNSTKCLLVEALRACYDTEESVQNLISIESERLISILWGDDLDPTAVRNKRKNLSSIRSSVNADFKRLYSEGKNPEGITIGPANTFIMSDEAKDNALEALRNSAAGDGRGLSAQMGEALKILSKFLDESGSPTDAAPGIDPESLDELRELMKNISRKIDAVGDDSGGRVGDPGLFSVDQALQTGEPVEEEFEELDEDLEEIADEDLEEVEEVDETEEIDDEDLEEVESEELVEEEEAVELDETEDAAELDVEEDALVEELDEEAVEEEFEELEDDPEEITDEDLEEVEEVDEAEEIEEELEEDETPEDVEEILDEEASLEEELEEAEEIEDEDLEEVESEELVEEEEAIELDETEDAEGLDVEEDALVEELDEEPVEEEFEELEDDPEEIAAEDLEEVEEVDEAEEIEEELEEDETPEEVEEILDEETPLEEELEEDLEEIDDEDLEEVESEELVDEEEAVELDDEALEEIDDSEGGDLEGAGSDDGEIPDIPDDFQEVDLLAREEGSGRLLENMGEENFNEEPENADKKKRRYLLSEQFNRSLAAMDRFFNQYILIPDGKYIAGNKRPKKDERPEMEIRLSSFYMGKFTITNSLFEIFVEKTGYRTTAERSGYGTVYHGRVQREVDADTGLESFIWNSALTSNIVEGACWYQPFGPGSTLHKKRNHPVVQVSFEDAMAFAAWTGKRLPKENEWEAAARTALGYPYPWGNRWKKDACNTEESGIGDTSPVDRFREMENEFGIADILGNVLEWTSTPFEDGVGSNGRSFIAKGGSWVSGRPLTLGSRFKLDARSASNILGFRCVAY